MSKDKLTNPQKNRANKKVKDRFMLSLFRNYSDCLGSAGPNFGRVYTVVMASTFAAVLIFLILFLLVLFFFSI